jgi:hypothetical protein
VKFLPSPQPGGLPKSSRSVAAQRRPPVRSGGKQHPGRGARPVHRGQTDPTTHSNPKTDYNSNLNRSSALIDADSQPRGALRRCCEIIGLQPKSQTTRVDNEGLTNANFGISEDFSIFSQLRRERTTPDHHALTTGLHYPGPPSGSQCLAARFGTAYSQQRRKEKTGRRARTTEKPERVLLFFFATLHLRVGRFAAWTSDFGFPISGLLPLVPLLFNSA